MPKRKLGLEEVSAIWNRPRYYDYRPQADMGTKESKGQSTPRRRDWINILGELNNSSRQAVTHYNNTVNNWGKQGVNKVANIAKEVNRKIRNSQRNVNTTSTSERSMQYEDKMRAFMNIDRRRNNYRTRDYDIPYGLRTVDVRLRKGAPLKSISVNALDSVAKYAGITGTPIQTALGLPTQETDWGRAPYINISRLPKSERTAFANANYFKAFGSIPQEYLVRDFECNGDMNGGKSLVPLNKAPLQHALEYFNLGNYNRGDKNHTSDVKAKGNALWNETTGNLRDWWNNEGIYWYNKGKKQ